MRAQDKVRVFGANMDSKFASRGAGLQNYEEKKIPAAVMEELLFQHGGDMEAAKKELRFPARLRARPLVTLRNY